MNKNPLPIKNFLIGKIPFMKGKTQVLYKKYLSEGKYSKLLKDHENLSEVLSAYSMNSTYKTDFVFDRADITYNTYFNEKEWIALGMVLRAYQEVEGLNLMHLYNCLFRGENNIAYGHVVTGRTYTIYALSQLETRLTIYTNDTSPQSLVLSSSSVCNPTTFTVEKEEGEPERLVRIEVKFSGLKTQRTMLAEGTYVGINLHTLKDSFQERSLIPEILGFGEYSSKLVEFFSGSLITPQSNSKLISYVNRLLMGEGTTFEEKVVNSTPGWHNKDGYLDRRIEV